MAPAKRPLKAPAKPAFDIQEYVTRFSTWAQTKTLADKGKVIHEKMNKEDLKPLILKYGQKDPETGSFFLEFPEPIDAGMYGKVDGVTATASTPRTLNEDRTVAFLEQKSREARVAGKIVLADGETKQEVDEDFDLLAEAQETITVLSEDKVIALHLMGKLTEKELDALYDTETKYAFNPHKYKG